VFEYDLFDWAVRKDNAILPGRTNRVEDVAEALGHGRNSAAAAVDGKITGEDHPAASRLQSALVT